MKSIFKTNYLVLIILAFTFYQCEDHQARFDDPPWLGGTNIETLEGKGNYNHFLALMDKAEYRRSIENQMFTLFVPNDSCFEAYFNSVGITSVEDLTIEQAEELFCQHMLINPRSRDKLLYEYYWNELQSPLTEYKSLFLRKDTYSVPIDYSEEVRYNKTYLGQTLKIYREQTLISFFSTEYFTDYFGDPNGADYLFMFPGSKWSGTQWHDAMVIPQADGIEARTSSGFIYFIDRVVAPIPTIDKYLHDNQEQFGLFYDIAQRFATYPTSKVNEQNERVYRKSYSGIFNIADERGPNSDGTAKHLYLFTAFIPSDNVLQEFLDNTVLPTYGSLDSVPQIFLKYLLKSHLNDFLILPTKMEDRFVNYLGEEIDMDTHTDISTSKMCSNGVIYVMNKILEPGAFTCVSGPIIYDKNYSTILYAFENSGLLTSLTQTDEQVTLFTVDNETLYDYGIRADEVADGIFYVQKRNSEGNWETLETDDLKEFIQDYYAYGTYDDFSGEGFIPLASSNYLYYNNNKIYNGGNQIDGDFCSVTSKSTEKNGDVVYLDNVPKQSLNAAEFILSDPDLSSFATLLAEADLIDSIQDPYEATGVKYPILSFMTQLKNWTILAPDNQAIADAEALGQIPDEQEALRSFINYHFIREKSIFDDGNISGPVTTQCVDTIIGTETTYKTLEIANTIHNLVVTDGAGSSISVNHSNANNLIRFGVIHKIGSVLLAEPGK
ncbi:MAG TPA: hypothetical protein DCQ26_07875 [Marinilabiliales bacterium]|jgi:uncharacterized surface protein with fasciclin (FAS1) repeats|nr:MAG: hypothetical protein A2W95_01310 [Bacteroidetes bacterium GWA2_40_14]OFX57960.1 MAG: hypothetical protein A2W84_17200 [Bacteroidetes bacterium GWC2_40_13]OFX73395.1 MAG: hypothetical protein A2W96_03775 [Bacteroidetes bacterium GWD2_40_43]OFX94745.1 MAG: hypothetical protein A2W97_18680 [Bacteroidetes bacterium GWE2_40_63]OFY24725.1 MAG: hypothetical protein A2W88_16630 [Bacteroidetes bacterium GWF2_40_13]OFZ27607.1 MAG: hypothetical protein A2437_05740 [Bacteroidetes bacterium RIFOXYC